MARRWFTRFGSVAGVLVLALSASVSGQTPPAGGQGMADHKQMMEHKAAMASKMAAADQKLSELLAAANAAQGEQKVAALTAVVNELIAQRRQMHETCGMMKAVEPKTEPDHAVHHPDK